MKSYLENHGIDQILQLHITNNHVNNCQNLISVQLLMIWTYRLKHG